MRLLFFFGMYVLAITGSATERPSTTRTRSLRNLFKRSDGCACCENGFGRRDLIRNGVLGVGTAGTGMYQLSQMQARQTQGSNIGQSMFADCMATRMGSYEDSVQKEKQRMFDKMFANVGTDSPHLLELGVGAGPNMHMYKDRVHKVTGVDANSHMEKYAYDNAQTAGVNLDFVVGDAQRLPFPDNSFDCAVVTHVLCSVENPSATLREISRVLKPGGTFLFWEHVRAKDDQPILKMQQDMLDPLQQVFFQGCHLNRDSLAAVRNCEGFAKVDAEEKYIGDRILLSPHAIGLAHKA